MRHSIHAAAWLRLPVFTQIYSEKEQKCVENAPPGKERSVNSVKDANKAKNYDSLRD